jgi:hypothetical protein
MSIFDNPNPFQEGGLAYDRDFKVYELFEDRLANSSSIINQKELFEFIGSEPQLVQRLTENLILMEDMAAMQKAPFRISTEQKGLSFKKGLGVYDQKTGKGYKILAIYPHEKGYDITLTELDD